MTRGRHIHRPGGMYAKVLAYLSGLDRDVWATTEAVAGHMGISQNYARDLLRDAVDDGLVEKPTHRARRWRLIRAAGEHADSGTHLVVKLTRGQATELVRAAVDWEIANPPGPSATDRVRARALHAGRVALTEAMRGEGR